MLKEQIEADLKSAMLAGDKNQVNALRTIKGALLDAEVAKGARGEGLPDDDVVSLLQKEAKKRRDSAELYRSAQDEARASQEEYEISLIDRYLPSMMSEAELKVVVDRIIEQQEDPTMQQMGQIIGAVKSEVGALGDGATIAKLVKERLTA